MGAGILGQWAVAVAHWGQTAHPEQRHLMHASAYGDGTAPLTEDLPYADESCDIAAELAHTHGQRISALAVGEDSFNFCFPDGHELETMIVPTNEGKIGLRVFWEQW